MKKLIIAVVLTVLAVGAWRFSRQAAAQALAGRGPRAPTVRVARPAAAVKVLQVALPGTVRPKDQVTLYARTNGFLRALQVDLGDVVKKDQVLARLDAPDLLAGLAQANARLEQARASLGLVRAQHARTQTLGTSGNLSAQDVDASSIRLQAAETELLLAVAEHQRLTALVGYLTVRAPFDGTINRRFVDDGALVSAERTALFELASTGALQIDVDVPQWAAAHVRPGLPATVAVGGQVVKVNVSRTAGALDPALRTLRTELVPEPGAMGLVPGAYVRVKFEVPRDEPVLKLPASALSMRGGISMVAVVGAGEVLHLVPVKVVQELGRDVEVLGELSPADRVALNLPTSLVDGDVVAVLEEPKKVAAAP
ncbi:MAG: efflux RND transporter periplasmic adaptor subunit [Archangium sp.]|nr:efflux RND transporter periplasmic adaptor subunit [Archangium sp.]